MIGSARIIWDAWDSVWKEKGDPEPEEFVRLLRGRLLGAVLAPVIIYLTPVWFPWVVGLLGALTIVCLLIYGAVTAAVYAYQAARLTVRRPLMLLVAALFLASAVAGWEALRHAADTTTKSTIAFFGGRYQPNSSPSYDYE